MAVKYVKEANNNNVDPKIQREHDALTNAGFKRMVINTFGTKVEPTDIAYEMEADDVLYELQYDEKWFDGKPGYILMITGDGEDVFIQNKEIMSLGSLIKISKLAKKYFAEYPATAKFMKRFADEYDMMFAGQNN